MFKKLQNRKYIKENFFRAGVLTLRTLKQNEKKNKLNCNFTKFQFFEFYLPSE